MSKDESRNLKFIPYSFWETMNWIGKHIIMDFYYPFMILIFFLFVTPVVSTSFIVVSIHWFFIFLILFCLFASLFIYRMVQRKIHRIANIGILNEDGWREFEFNNSNSKKEVKYTIGFIGDIMKMDEYILKFEKRIQKFFDGVDLIVGNLEGIILTDKTKNGGIATQNHSSRILKQLEQMIPESTQQEKRTKWLLSVSNNHSADFGDKGFKNSRDFINSNPNFYAFGDLDISHSSFPWDPTQNMDGINIVTGTMWTNKKSQNLISRFKSYDEHYKPKKFNILFPHWHFENECYIRSKIQRKSINLILKGEYKERNWITIYRLIEQFSPIKILLKLPLIQKMQKFLSLYKKPKVEGERETQKWDLIFGHHSHVPQPIKNYGTGIISYSGGNFTSSKRRKKHISGLIMKCELCDLNKTGQLQLGKINWCYTLNERKKKKMKDDENRQNDEQNKKIKEVNVIIDCLRTRKKCFENRNIKFKTNLIIFSVVLGIWLGVFWLLGTINYFYWIIYAILMIALFVYFGLKYSRFTSKI